MAKNRGKVSEICNAFSTGNGGGNFERHVQAVFALALVLGGYAPVANVPVERLDFQAKRLGYDVDDLVVTSPKSDKQRKLLCQIKHSLSVTAKDSIFQEVITAAWSDFKKESFNDNADKIALITGFIAKDSIHALRNIHDQAQICSNSSEFEARIYQASFLSKAERNKLDVIKACIQVANQDSPASEDEVWRFCRCFVLAVFDVDYQNSVNRVLIQSLIQCNSDQSPALVWNTMSEQCGEWNQQAASVVREVVPKSILELFSGKKTSSQRHKAEQQLATDLSPSRMWALIALIGGWNDDNEYDMQSIETLCGTSYDLFQKDCQELLQGHPEYLHLKNGIWQVENRKAIINSVRSYYFDKTIKGAFQIATIFLGERSKQFSDNGQYSILIPSTGRFNNSDAFRKGILEGLCIFANSPQLPNCTSNLVAKEAQSLVRTVFEKADWFRLASISQYYSVLAEMAPDAYLENLEKMIIRHPTEVEKLFPKKEDSVIGTPNFISGLLFSIERLAWHEDYLVNAVRCLGELECLNYEDTNHANTPLNTILCILTPFMPQTCASIEKQKNAVNAIRIEHPEVFWNIVIGLLPQRGLVMHSVKPEYISIEIPHEPFISGEDRRSLFRHYIREALAIAEDDNNKLMYLLKHTDYMSDADKETLLEIIRIASNSWDDQQKCDLWISLSDWKYRVILESDGGEPDLNWFDLLRQTIDLLCPQSVILLNQRLYLSTYNEFQTGENPWDNLDEAKQAAVEEVYASAGIDGIITFGESVRDSHDVAARLGKLLSSADMAAILPRMQADSTIGFYSTLLRSYLIQNGAEAIASLNLQQYSPSLIVSVLVQAPFSQKLLDLLPQYLPEHQNLFWESVNITSFDAVYGDYDLSLVLRTLLHFRRAHVAVSAIGQNIKQLNVDDTLIHEILMQAPMDAGAQSIHRYSACKLIQHLQNSQKLDINTLSEIEYIYLPWLKQHASVHPRAIYYRLANEPMYFCNLIEMAFKKRHDDKKPNELPEAVSDRIFQLLFPYTTIPGTDWKGEFHSEIFTSWINEVGLWAEENDRLEVTFQIVGDGLSYAKYNDMNLIDPAIMKVLNDGKNGEMRNGYHSGVFNQRGVHWVDPEGKAEKELAQKYLLRAAAAEHMGYSRFSNLLRAIASDYLAEARDNAESRDMDED